MSKFLSSDRLLNLETEQLNVLSEMLNQEIDLNIPLAAETRALHVKKMEESNAEEMAALYQQVFESYPFPIYDPAYIRKTMKNDVQYFGIETEGKLAALASAEIDRKGLNAEMTDFATLPAFRGRKLSILLLHEMEQQMQLQGIKTLFTIARLNSVGMNKTFIRMGYTYSGTLLKNTNIAGKIESMNIFYKHV
jgi:putative beta-lysine N-acetyltransferase